MLNISYFKQYFYFFGNQYRFPFLISILTFLTYFSIISSVIGTGILNITLILFDLVFLYFLFLNRKKIKFYFNKMIFFSVLIFLILNLIFSTKFEPSFYGFSNIVKNFIFLIGCYTLFKMNKNILKNFIGLSLIVFIFTGADTLIQFLFGKDIFGYPYLEVHGGRLSGPFGDELIVGSFLSKTLFISIIYFIFNYEKKYYDVFFLFISLSLIFITNERSASLMALMSSFIYLFFRFKNLKIRTIFFSTLIFLTILLVSMPSTKNQLIIKTFEQFGLKESVWQKHDNFFDSQWGAHYLTAISIFKNYPLFGSGLKTFRYECQKKKYDDINSKSSNLRCSTHPHNFYLEILSETGIIGFAIFFSFLILIFKNILKDIFKKKNKSGFITISIFFLFFWPLKTTGSIWASWNSFFYVLALLIIMIEHNLIKVKIK